METVDTIVIGAGVVGLAIARSLALAGREVLVLEAEAAFGTQTSARNSEVIHAGLYYPRNSLKAALCVRGKELLYRYCAERNIPHRRLGKLLIATDASELAALASYVGVYCTIEALKQLPAAVVFPITLSAPILLGMVISFLHREKIRPAGWIGVLAGICGITILAVRIYTK